LCAHRHAPVITENNAEYYIGASDAFITVANWVVFDGTYKPVYPR
jgi:hypothetical protein